MNHDHVHPLFRDVLNALCKGAENRPCAGCSSPYCGTHRCRFEDTEVSPRAANDTNFKGAA